MNKTSIPCPVMQNLLPLYAEGLTSEETADAIRAHLDECAECRALYQEGMKHIGISIPKLDNSPKRDRKIIWRIRAKFLWYMSWPLLYALSWQFGFQETVSQLLLIITAGILIIPLYTMQELNFDPEKRKEFYRREGKKMEEDKSTVFSQYLFLVIPVIVPLAAYWVPLGVGIVIGG